MKLLQHTITEWTVALLSVGTALYALFVYGFLEAGSTVHPDMKSVYAVHTEGLYLHIIGSLTALMVGPFLFSFYLRNNYLSYHRIGGRVYLTAVLLGGIGGFYMAFYAYGGLVSTFGFGMLAVLWLYTGYHGLTAVLEKDISAHRKWMIRNFALTFAAVTFRIYLGLFFASGVPFEAFYPIVSWLCWVPNLLIVESRFINRLPKVNTI